MIKVTYENTETGQTMVVSFKPSKKNKRMADIEVDFSPDLTDDTKDPGGIMQSVFQALTGGLK